MASFVMPQISNSLSDPSSNSLADTSCGWTERACWVSGKLRRSSMHLYNSSIPDRPVRIVSAVESDDTSRVLSLFSSSLILRVLGWDLEGKLIDRMWCLVLVFEEVAIDVLALTRGLKFLMANSKLYGCKSNDAASSAWRSFSSS
ncbi:hypothetical protein RJ639_005186 [Escallonia herrerae]|uniref:Uncharacterized protein n=1 Tax=Escallonia herrerae TaxID=1293975 RepID=A0AA89B0D5_9ASTE|nr:hypothetical protein RJ639_005186 [Escallonia herrerae]